MITSRGGLTCPASKSDRGGVAPILYLVLAHFSKADGLRIVISEP